MAAGNRNKLNSLQGPASAIGPRRIAPGLTHGPLDGATGGWQGGCQSAVADGAEQPPLFDPSPKIAATASCRKTLKIDRFQQS